jgi:hypothetical protein
MERHELRDTAYRPLQLGTSYLTLCLACSVSYSQLVLVTCMAGCRVRGWKSLEPCDVA